MQRRIGRTILAAASSAGLIFGGTMSASASDGHDDHGGHQRYGWVKVCQDVKKYDDHQGKDDSDEYVGKYQVRDSYGSSWRFELKGRYDCRQVKVHKGKVNVKVVYKPDFTELKGYADRWLNVKRDAYEKTTFEYKALDYGWVKVCQDVKKYDDHGRDDHNDYKGTYEVEDSYGDTSKVYLEGKYDCDSVKVHTGKADVKVVYKPEHTELKGYDEVYVDVYKNEYETVTFHYRAEEDHYSIGASANA